ncbi:tRNA pseudouridine(55) synthase TruB [Pseudoramibacter faecis]|uniref:tRNA pseudouridine(55) synthase TruB n=1 Tax=Pseudoramibacter faecis TaxID=3108534 RepID=UPI002E76A54C|nr:tRNA pseudouridine(55) synthase TruB [Pseudoramibacter sp. HA2172]
MTNKPVKQPNGVLIVDKPKGMTSHDLINRLRRLYQFKKIGHTGTLDPNASGVMVVCFGQATKFIQYFTDTDKTYRAEVIFGLETDTYDATGKVLRVCTPDFSIATLRHRLQQFKGDLMQKPPIYSALKKDGKKYYDYARAGRMIKLPERPIRIYQIEIQRIGALPQRCELLVHCSSGTYIRSLCHDLGTGMNTYACMGDLRRTAVGRWRIENAHTLSNLEKMSMVERFEGLQPAERFLDQYDSVQSNARGDRFIGNGAELYAWNSMTGFERLEADQLLRIYDSQGRFKGIGQFRLNGKVQPTEPCVRPLKMMSPE